LWDNIVKLRDLLQEFGLPAIAWMPNTNHRLLPSNPVGCCGCIVSHRDYARRSKQCDKHLQQFLASPALAGIVLAIGERFVRFVRVEWKNVPQKYPSIYLVKHAPNNCRRPLGD
jgi:hypothetical protein